MPTPAALSSVVVPTDFSEGAWLALARALTLPLAKKAKLTVVHVVPDDIPGKLRRQALDEAERSVEKQLARARAALLERGRAGVTLVGDVLEGAPAQQLLKRAHTVEAELIALGRHGRRPVADLFIGTTAQKVARAGDVPVLLVQLSADRRWARALAAVSLDKQAPQVVRAAAALLPDEVETLHVLHASSIPYEDFVAVAPPDLARVRERELATARARLGHVLKRAGAGLSYAVQVRTGDARSLILDEAKALDADLLAVGTHGRKGVQKLFLGSVAEWVLTHAKCDVLVVPH